MITVAAMTPAHGARDVSADHPVFATINAPAGAKEASIIETTLADWAAGTLTNVVAVNPGNLELGRHHEETFEAYPTGAFPPSGWAWSGPGSGSATVEQFDGSKTLRMAMTSGDRFAIWTAAGNGNNVNAYAEIYAPGTFNQYPGIMLRMGNASNYYAADISGTSARIGRVAGGSWTTLATTGVALAPDQWYSLRFEVTGTTLRMRVWVRGTQEPSSWTLTATDSTHATGSMAIKVGTPAASTTYFDNIRAAGLAGGGTVYVAAGNRVSPLYQLGSSVGVFGAARISWTATVPAATTLTVEASVNGGAWQTCTNGGAIPGVVSGGTATSVQVRISLATTNSAVSPNVADLTMEFYGLDIGAIEVVVDGMSCTVANGRLEYWGHRRIVGGVITQQWLTVGIAASALWFRHGRQSVTVTVRYFGAQAMTTTWMAAEHEGVTMATAWWQVFGWQAAAAAYGNVTAFYYVVDWQADRGWRELWYLVEPPPDTMATAWYLVGHYRLVDLPAAGALGRRTILDGAGAATVRGWTRCEPPAAGVIQGWRTADGCAAAVVGRFYVASLAAAGVLGRQSTTTGAAAAIIYGVQRRTHIEVRSCAPETAALFATLGVTRG